MEMWAPKTSMTIARRPGLSGAWAPVYTGNTHANDSPIFTKTTAMNRAVKDFLASENISESDYFIAVIHGSRNRTLKSFVKKIGKAFNFPSYYGKNIGALHECINDLEWIVQPNYILIIKGSEDFLSKEAQETRDYIISLLNGVSEDWANVPNYEGEDVYRKKADFKIKWL